MSTNVNREDLLKKLLRIKPAVSTQAYIPILSHFLFDGDSVTAYNDINAISTPCDTGIKACIPAELLIKALGSLSTKEINLGLHDSYVLISAGKTRIKLPVLPESDFPFPIKKWQAGTAEKAAKTFNMSLEMLEGLEKCLISVGKDSFHPAQMGVTLDSIYSVGQGAFYSTDNTTLSRFLFDTELELTPVLLFSMPTFFCNQMVALNTDSVGIAIEIYADALIACFADGTLLFTRIVPDLQLLNFALVIDKYLARNFEGTEQIPEAFKQAIERALLVQSEEQYKKVSVIVDNGKLILESVSKFGESLDTMDFIGSDVEFMIDPAKVKRALEITTEMALLSNVMVLGDNHNFIHLIAHCSK